MSVAVAAPSGKLPAEHFPTRFLTEVNGIGAGTGIGLTVHPLCHAFPYRITIMRKACSAFALVFLWSAGTSQAQQPKPDDVPSRYFVGTTLFVLYNLVPDPYPPRYAQVNVGLQLSPADALSLEAITWQYYGPLGRPYGQHSGDSNFPGRVRAYGLGLAYKRDVLGGWYVAVHATPLLQEYLDEDGALIQTGFQLFNSFRVGYDAPLFGGRVYVQPSVAVTNWPVNTNLPASFQAEEDKWPNYFLFEPGLHVGVRF